MPRQPAAEICECMRCHVLLQVAHPNKRNPNARAIKLAKQPKGLCLECAVAEFFVVHEIRRLIPDPKALLLSHVQAQFRAVLKAAFSDAAYEAIQWRLVVERWDLPFPGDGTVRGISTAKEQDHAAATDPLFANRRSPAAPPPNRDGKWSLN